MTGRLIADIGGTNARFAFVEGAVPGPAIRLPTADFETFEPVLEAALDALPGATTATEAVIAAAGPVLGEAIDLTNLPWRIERSAVSIRLGGARVRLLNDMEAVALALPVLGPDHRVALRAGLPPEQPRPMLAVNVGTGFGAALAVPTPERWVAVPGEPGHMRLAPLGPEEGRHFRGFASVEDLLSGRGLVALHRALGGTAEDAGAVFAAEPGDQAARTALDLFATCLGRIAGDLVLATGAWGGAWLCGGVVSTPRGDRFSQLFLDAFDDKGPMRSAISAVPVHHITADDPALLGLAAFRF